MKIIKYINTTTPPPHPRVKKIITVSLQRFYYKYFEK